MADWSCSVDLFVMYSIGTYWEAHKFNAAEAIDELGRLGAWLRGISNFADWSITGEKPSRKI